MLQSLLMCPLRKDRAVVSSDGSAASDAPNSSYPDLRAKSHQQAPSAMCGIYVHTFLDTLLDETSQTGWSTWVFAGCLTRWGSQYQV